MVAFFSEFVDWSRVGELLRAGNHRYTTQQLLVRGSIIAFTAGSGFLAAYLNDEEKTHCSSLTLAIAASCVGFVLSHTVVIYPMIRKRYGTNNECIKLIDDINSKLNDLIESDRLTDDVREKVITLIESIGKETLATDNRSNVSETWGHRKRLLMKLSDYLDNGDLALLRNENRYIISELKNPQENQSLQLK